MAQTHAAAAKGRTKSKVTTQAAEPRSFAPKKGETLKVGTLVAQLLTGDKTKHLDYAAIAERVKKRIPDAKTSTRSVASVAHALRASGLDIQDRRAKH